MGRVRNKADTGYLYLIKLSSINTYEKEEFYKIGVSNKGVIGGYRYSKDLKYSIEVFQHNKDFQDYISDYQAVQLEEIRPLIQVQ